jgi:hypothetical protein
VKLNSLMRGSSAKRAAFSPLTGRIENAPGGNEVSARISPIMRAPTGVALAGFNTNGHPTASAGATLCATRFSGKLNGVMNEHTPMGTRFHMPR